MGSDPYHSGGESGNETKDIADPGLCQLTPFLSELRHKDRSLVQEAAVQLEGFLDRTWAREFHVGIHIPLA